MNDLKMDKIMFSDNHSYIIFITISYYLKYLIYKLIKFY